MIAIRRGLRATALTIICCALNSCSTAPDKAGGGAPGSGGSTASARATPRNVELVELHADWNRACRMQGVATKSLAVEFKDKVKIKRIDTEADPDAMKRYGIDSGPPAIAIIVDGEVKLRMSGLQSTSKLRKMLSDALGGK